ncbi:MAG: hypothetical protein HDS08_00710 [Bacteroides sp.]|nr:hypothetical protein [Bacteroides sp.]
MDEFSDKTQSNPQLEDSKATLSDFIAAVLCLIIITGMSVIAFRLINPTRRFIDKDSISQLCEIRYTTLGIQFMNGGLD